MKTRNGFVSNSSSQSWIVRGMVVNLSDIEDILQIEADERRPSNSIRKAIMEKFPETKISEWESSINVWENMNWFRSSDGDSCESLIIGRSIGGPEDGDWEIIPEHDDNELLELLAKILSLKVTEIELNTYFRYISTDNY